MSEAFDSSVMIPLLVAEMPRHNAAGREFSALAHAPAHAALETYSVMTRLPGQLRRPGPIATQAIRASFQARFVPGLPAEELGDWLTEMAARGVVGGAIYDALVAESARRADMELVTFDARARPTYDRVGVRYRYVDPG